jgi:hypothetical protein
VPVATLEADRLEPRLRDVPYLRCSRRTDPYPSRAGATGEGSCETTKPSRRRYERPKLSFRGIDRGNPRSRGWLDTRSQALVHSPAAMTHGDPGPARAVPSRRSTEEISCRSALASISGIAVSLPRQTASRWEASSTARLVCTLAGERLRVGHSHCSPRRPRAVDGKNQARHQHPGRVIRDKLSGGASRPAACSSLTMPNKLAPPALPSGRCAPGLTPRITWRGPAGASVWTHRPAVTSRSGPAKGDSRRCATSVDHRRGTAARKPSAL